MKVQLMLPQELYNVIWKDVEAKITSIQYSRVIMCLSELLEGDFFNKYIKIGISSLGHDSIDLWHISIYAKSVFILLTSSSFVRRYPDAL